MVSPEPLFTGPPGVLTQLQNFDVEFASPITSNNILADFDFDSSLHDNENGREDWDFESLWDQYISHAPHLPRPSEMPL